MQLRRAKGRGKGREGVVGREVGSLVMVIKCSVIPGATYDRRLCRRWEKGMECSLLD